MSIIYCEKHDRRWDSDKLDDCPLCENEDDGRLALDTPERRDQEKYFGEGQEPEQEDDNG